MRRGAHALRCFPLRLKVALHPRDVVADFVVACVVAHQVNNRPHSDRCMQLFGANKRMARDGKESQASQRCCLF
jgi:hypothetical protein